MKKSLAFAALALYLTMTACGPKQETTQVPGGRTVTTTQQGDGTQVTVTGPSGETSTVTTVDQGGGSQEAASVTGRQGGGTFRASNQVEEKAFTVPFYPGADVVSGGQHEATDADGQTTRTATAELSTKDPVDRVAAFYADKVQAANRIDTTMEGKRTVVYAPTEPSQGTSVTVTQDEDGTTRITLVCQGK